MTTTQQQNDQGPGLYRVKMKHDAGTIIFKTYASSHQAARELVCKAEGAPECAIVWSHKAGKR